MGHKRNPTMPASSRHHSSSTRKQGRNRSASFSDFVAPHLIRRASDDPIANPSSRQRSEGIRGGSITSARQMSQPPPYEDEKKKLAEWKSSSSPTDTISSLPTLSASPPPLPPKDYPVSSAQQKMQQSGETCTPRVAMRLTARVLGRTFGAPKGGQRSPKGQSADDEWVVV